MMYSEDITLENISRIIARSQHLIGKNCYSSWICKNQAKLLDLIWTRRTTLSQFHGGSTAEGTTTTNSDVDRMAVMSNIQVLTSSHVSESDENIFHMDPSKSNPGYVRLAPANRGWLHHDDLGDFTDVLEESSDGTFLSSDKFVNAMNARIVPPVPYYSKYCYRHGPCLMVEHQNIYGYHKDTPGELLEADLAFSLVCDRWPEEAREWITRERNHDWPSKELIDIISCQQCHAVAVGDPTSKFCSQEWRISFLLGERELIWSFNDTQIQCYIILKKLLKKYIEPLVPDQLSSYHIKTLMFWMTEEEGLSRWTEENLLTCIQDCLSRLKKCVKEGKLQHYFHRRRNLLRYKLSKTEEKELVIRNFVEIKDQIITYVLDGGFPDGSKLYKIWRACNGRVEMLENPCSKDLEITTYFGICKKVNDTRRLFQSLFNIYVNTTDCCDSLSVLLRIKEELENEPPNDVDTKYMKLTQHFLDIRIGLRYYYSAVQASDESSRSDLQFKCWQYLTSGAQVDELSGLLYLASLYVCKNDLSSCKEAVLKVITKPNRYLCTGRCSIYHGIEIEAGNILQTPEVPVTGEDDEIIKPIFDIVFTKEDIEFLPYLVKFECALVPEYGERFFVFHPLVYANMLLYLTEVSVGDVKLAGETLKCLAKIIYDSGATAQKYRALNLLGFCYSLYGDIKHALSCYTESLRETACMLDVNNAAAYHLAILYFGAFCSLSHSGKGRWGGYNYVRLHH